MCGGLPLSLAVVGKAIQSYKDDSRPFKAFAMFESTSESNRPQTEALDAPGMEGYIGFGKVMDTTWSMLESQYRKISGRPVAALRKLHAALCIFGNQVQVPTSVLQKLWRIEPEAAVLQIVKGMADLSLVHFRDDPSGSPKVSVHDLLHAYCVREADDSDTKTADWHCRLLGAYSCATEGPKRKWWECESMYPSDCESMYDGYLRTNLARHLHGGNIDSELQALLTDYRWLYGCVSNRRMNERKDVELRRIEEDYALLVRILKGSPNPDVDQQHYARWYAFTVIPEALRLSWSRIVLIWSL